MAESASIGPSGPAEPTPRASEPELRTVPCWQPPAATAPAGAPIERRALVLPDAAQRVALSADGEALPFLAASADRRGTGWRKFELPALPAGSAPGLVIEWADGSRTRTSGAAIPPSAEADVAGEAPAELAERRRGLAATLAERQAAGADVFRAGANGESLAVPLGELEPLWRRHHAPGAVEHELVRRWADRLEWAIKGVCRDPRTALARERRVASAQRIREIDAVGLRDLARQPGITPAEKAGNRQRLLGVVRAERLATLENRAAAMIVRELEAEGRRVLAEAGPDAATAPVERLLGVIEHLKPGSELLTLAPPSGAMRANHVLRNDPRYRLLWHAHLELAHRSRRRADAARWRHRVWAESCVLALANRLEARFPRSPAARSCVVLRRRAEAGRAVDPTTALGRWETGEASLILIEGRDLARFHGSPFVPEPLIAMAPDALLVRRPSHGAAPESAVLTALWCQWASDDTERLAARCETAAHLLQQAGAAGELRGLLVEPAGPDGSGESATRSAAPRVRRAYGAASAYGACHGVRLPLPLAAAESGLDAAIDRIVAAPATGEREATQ